MLKPLYYFTFLLLFASQVSWAAVPIKDVTLLGIKLSDSNLDKVREHMWDIGGFLQDRSTVKQRNIDKFFTSSNLKESSYVKFRYNNSGYVTSAIQLYRPISIHHKNSRNPIQTRDVALDIIRQIGEPNQVLSKGWGGSPNYRSYIWKDEYITVIVDREGGEIFGRVFVKFIVNKQDPFYVEVLKQ